MHTTTHVARESFPHKDDYVDAIYHTLPMYGQGNFWRVIEDNEMPLEVLVRVLRHKVSNDDRQGRERLMMLIFERVKSRNECWAHGVLKNVTSGLPESCSFFSDLCSALAEAMLRAINDPRRHFWEQHFEPCLQFERKHVFFNFSVAEGWIKRKSAKYGARIPRELMFRDDIAHIGEVVELIEDERATQMLLDVERSEIMYVVDKLPDGLKYVVVLLYWHSCTIKDIARMLHVSERTIYYRLRSAHNRLRNELRKSYYQPLY